jgi:hypothetical protein
MDMSTYKYCEKALKCLLANKEELGITEELASQILLELNDKHSLDVWETEWLTFSDKWVYFDLKCIDETQKEKLWDLVLCLTKHFENPAQYTMPSVVSNLLTELHSYI